MGSVLHLAKNPDDAPDDGGVAAVRFAEDDRLHGFVGGLEDDGVLIRVGRYDVHTKEVKTFESMVPENLLQPRSVPCSYEDELAASS